MPIKFNDTIHGSVLIPDEFRIITESKVLSRLRNIRQLGFTHASYSGAVHTRFEHTIGTVAVLLKLMIQFGLTDRALQRQYLRAALLSEIGIFPFSYSTRPIFKEIALSKLDISSLLYNSFLKHELTLKKEEEDFIFKSENRDMDWFKPILSIKAFSYLDPIKLASTIDYVLRDSYFTGRMPGGFDYRYFMSLGNGKNMKFNEPIYESLRALHRSIFNLNQTYGDPLRRTLSQILYELVMHLSKENFLDIESFKNPYFLLNLDDDEFLYLISESINKSKLKGDRISYDMYNVVTQRVVPNIINYQIKDDEKSTVTILDKKKSIKEEISATHNCETERIFFLDSPFDDQIGFRMFGTEFSNVEDAIKSDIFKECTGLTNNLKPLDRLSNIRILLV